MKINNILWPIFCLTFFFINVNSNAQPHTPALARAGKVIAQINLRYFTLFAKSDAAIINLYTSDACLLLPNAPQICGSAALSKDFKDTFIAGKVKGVKFVTLNVYGDGLSYVTEEGTWQVFGPGGKEIDNGKYLKLWRKTNNGWKIFRDCFNSSRSGR
jgi:ketosteroid isomerase-like protein